MPPLTMPAIAAASWMAVTDRPCPNAIWSRVLSASDVDGTEPDASPGRPRPVVDPSPNERRYSTSLVLSICRVRSTVPMFEEFATTPRAVRLIVLWVNASLIGLPPDITWLGTTTLVSGVMTPESVRAAIVSTFCTEPGSYASVIARLPRLAAEAVPGEFAVSYTHLTLPTIYSV